jgi:hypothetical protein
MKEEYGYGHGFDYVDGVSELTAYAKGLIRCGECVGCCKAWLPCCGCFCCCCNDPYISVPQGSKAILTE